MEKNYPPKGEFYMYPQYDKENNLIGFTTDYEGEGAFGKYCKIIVTGETLQLYFMIQKENIDFIINQLEKIEEMSEHPPRVYSKRDQLITITAMVKLLKCYTKKLNNERA